MHNNSIDCEVLTGISREEQVLIRRAKLAPSEHFSLFKLQPAQFPSTVAFVTTIIKKQSQILMKVRTILPKPVFTYGYVALNRTRSFYSVRIFITEDVNNDVFNTNNVVYKEVF